LKIKLTGTRLDIGFKAYGIYRIRMSAQDEECPICYESYACNGKDGKFNSDMAEICNHAICGQCCKQLYSNAIRTANPNIKCPLCREDWTDWILSHYDEYDTEEEEEENDEVEANRRTLVMINMLRMESCHFCNDALNGSFCNKEDCIRQHREFMAQEQEYFRQRNIRLQ